MKIKGWFKKLLNSTDKNEISPDDTIDIDGEKVSINDLTKSVEDEEKEKLAADEKPKEQELSEDSMIQVGGKEVSIKNAIETYKARKNRKNAAEDEAKKKADEELLAKKNADEAAAAKAEEDRKNAEEETLEAKKKREDEAALAKKNADEAAAKEAEEKEKKEAETLKNSAHFLTLKNASEQRHALKGPVVQIIEDKRAKGVELYGKK